MSFKRYVCSSQMGAGFPPARCSPTAADRYGAAASAYNNQEEFAQVAAVVSARSG